MRLTVTMDGAGRVVIPKNVRNELQIESGDTLELESEGDRVTLRPVRSSTPLHKERGVWVYRTGKKLATAVTERAIRDVREQRAGHSFRGEQ